MENRAKNSTKRLSLLHVDFGTSLVKHRGSHAAVTRIRCCPIAPKEGFTLLLSGSAGDGKVNPFLIKSFY